MSDPDQRLPWRAMSAAALVGLALSAVTAAVVGIGRDDTMVLVGTSFGAACITLVLASAVLIWLGRSDDRPERVRVVIVGLIPVVSFAAGALAAARSMFVSTHDLRALGVVIASAGTAGVIGGILAAHELAEGRRRLENSRATQERLERSRRELVAWVSHDLRTPLAGIRAMSEALVDGVVTDAETMASYHARIQREMERLTQLVDDLFELSRIEVDAVRLTLEPVSLHDLVSDAIASADPVAGARGVELVGRIDGPSPVLDLSSPEMLRVVHNLLDNAIRHTPSGGSVLVDVSSDEAAALVSVSDECGGIADHDLDRVFDLAYRGDPSRSPADSTGAGLGLAIARGFVEAHRGQLSVRNEGNGCCFKIRLPLSAEPGRDERSHAFVERSGRSESEETSRSLR